MTTTFGPAFDAQWRQRFERFAVQARVEADVSGWSEVGLARRVETFSRLLSSIGMPAGRLVLDLGCGAGTYSRLLASRRHRVVGFDYSVPSLGRALEYDPHGACRYAAGDAYNLPFAAATFDLVVCIGVLQAVATPDIVVREAARVLRPRGVLVIEALNARAAAARVGRLHAAVRRLPPRVRYYHPRCVADWLAVHHLEPFARVPIVLPPRKLRGVLRVLDLVRTSTRVSGAPVTEALAHAFLYAARRTGAP